VKHSHKMRLLAALIGALAGLLALMTFYHQSTSPAAFVWPGDRLFESEEASLGRELTAAGFWRIPQHSGVYYNFNAQGERLIPGPPIHPRHTLWFFGNSQLVAPYVSDGQASLALVQALLPHLRVVNRSAGGQAVSGELAWLKETQTQPGDGVVFISGSGDSEGEYHRVMELAKAYAASRGLIFLSIVQPSRDGKQPAGKPAFSLPAIDFTDNVHLTSKGEVDFGLSLYRLLTTL
jgi:hypothetical protein